VKNACTEEQVEEPDVFSEFGSYTVAESGMHLFRVMGSKQQNDREQWYMIDGSIMNNVPDIWGINQRFILLPINRWNANYQSVNIGGLSCDVHDYYNKADEYDNQIFLPRLNGKNDPLYIGFFHTGAYQDSLTGFGGIKHCLLPSPKHVVVNREEDGALQTRVFSERQTAASMLNILGYNPG
jgi:arginine decarboxylase